MNKEIASRRKYLREENAKHPMKMTYVSEPWPLQPGVDVVGVWRSCSFLAQLVLEKKSNMLRLSIQRTMINERGDWVDGISWDEMMQVKRECGLGHLLAVEVYPKDKDIVNIANMRHLFFPEGLEIGWVAP